MARKSTAPKSPVTSSAYMDFEQCFDAAIHELHEYPGNPRKNDHVVQDMATMIETHGFRVPILVTTRKDGEYDIVDGHLRLKAARELGMETLPAYLVDDMSKEQIKAFRTSVNKAAELADWDIGKLATEVKSINVPSADLSRLTGLGDTEIANLTQAGAPGDKAPKTTTKSKQVDKASVTAGTDNVTLTLTTTASKRELLLNGLEMVAEKEGLDSNTDAVSFLVDQYVGQKTKTRRRRSSK